MFDCFNTNQTTGPVHQPNLGAQDLHSFFSNDDSGRLEFGTDWGQTLNQGASFTNEEVQEIERLLHQLVEFVPVCAATTTAETAADL